MQIMTNNQILSQEDVKEHFVLEGSRLYRKFSDGAARQLASRDASKVVCMFRGARLLGVDIAWCLLYGNWPVFPIVQIKSDPYDFSAENLFPARLRQLRYCQTPAAHLWRHNLTSLTFKTPGLCRADWEERARDFYVKDLHYVQSIEANERKLRAEYIADLVEANKNIPKPRMRREKAAPTAKPKKPTAVAGREWHYNAGEWISVPVACHVADDYMVRIRRQRAGAVRHEFQPAYGEVWGFDAAGVVVP